MGLGVRCFECLPPLNYTSSNCIAIGGAPPGATAMGARACVAGGANPTGAEGGPPAVAEGGPPAVAEGAADRGNSPPSPRLGNESSVSENKGRPLAARSSGGRGLPFPPPAPAGLGEGRGFCSLGTEDGTPPAEPADAADCRGGGTGRGKAGGTTASVPAAFASMIWLGSRDPGSIVATRKSHTGSLNATAHSPGMPPPCGWAAAARSRTNMPAAAVSVAAASGVSPEAPARDAIATNRVGRGAEAEGEDRGRRSAIGGK